MSDIYDFAQTVDIGDVKELLDRQIDCNTAIAREGLTHSYGANIGQVIRAASPRRRPHRQGQVRRRRRVRRPDGGL